MDNFYSRLEREEDAAIQRDEIAALRVPVANQADIDLRAAQILRMQLRECPQCNRKFLSTINRCPFCEGV